MIDTLQTKFGIPGAVSVLPGKNNMPRVTLAHRSGASAEIYLHGAHVTSWRNAASEELFFLSRESVWAADKPIRGGIPICFPQFSNHGPLPLHGFARINEWVLTQTERLGSGEVVAALQLSDSDATLALWPHQFTIELRATLAEAALTLAVQHHKELMAQAQAHHEDMKAHVSAVAESQASGGSTPFPSRERLDGPPATAGRRGGEGM